MAPTNRKFESSPFENSSAVFMNSIQFNPDDKDINQLDQIRTTYILADSSDYIKLQESEKKIQQYHFEIINLLKKNSSLQDTILAFDRSESEYLESKLKLATIEKRNVELNLQIISLSNNASILNPPSATISTNVSRNQINPWLEKLNNEIFAIEELKTFIILKPHSLSHSSLANSFLSQLIGLRSEFEQPLETKLFNLMIHICSELLDSCIAVKTILHAFVDQNIDEITCESNGQSELYCQRENNDTKQMKIEEHSGAFDTTKREFVEFKDACEKREVQLNVKIQELEQSIIEKDLQVKEHSTNSVILQNEIAKLESQILPALPLKQNQVSEPIILEIREEVIQPIEQCRKCDSLKVEIKNVQIESQVQITQLQEYNTNLSNDLESMSNEYKNQKSGNAHLQAKVQDLDNQIKVNQNTIQNQEQVIIELRVVIASKIADLSQSVQTISDLEAKLEASQIIKTLNIPVESESDSKSAIELVHQVSIHEGRKDIQVQKVTILPEQADKSSECNEVIDFPALEKLITSRVDLNQSTTIKELKGTKDTEDSTIKCELSRLRLDYDALQQEQMVYEGCIESYERQFRDVQVIIKTLMEIGELKGMSDGMDKIALDEHPLPFSAYFNRLELMHVRMNQELSRMGERIRQSDGLRFAANKRESEAVEKMKNIVLKCKIAFSVCPRKKCSVKLK